MDLYNDTYLPDILHDIAQGLLTPVMVLIVALIAVTLFFLGAVIVEFFTERRHFKQNMPRIVNQINDAGYGDVAQVVSDGQLLRYQKAALITAARNMGLPEEPLFALAQNQIAQAEGICKRRPGLDRHHFQDRAASGPYGHVDPAGPGHRGAGPEQRHAAVAVADGGVRRNGVRPDLRRRLPHRVEGAQRLVRRVPGRLGVAYDVRA